MRDKLTGLTEKQLAFCKEFAVDSKAGRAYLAVGYKCTNEGLARILAYKLLQKDTILAVIKAEKAKLVEKTSIKQDISIESVLADLRIAKDACLDDAGKLLKHCVTAFLKCIELEGKYLAMWTENINTTDTQRQRELNAAEQAEASELARLRLVHKYHLHTAPVCQTVPAGEVLKGETG